MREASYRWFDRVLVLAAIVAVVCAAEVFVSSKRSTVLDQVDAPVTGALLPPFWGRVHGVGDDSIRFEGRNCPTLIISFQSTCPYCEETSAQWASLTHAVRRGCLRLAITPDDEHASTDWLRQHGIVVDMVVTPLDGLHFLTRWKLNTVPRTLVVDPKGMLIFHSASVLGPRDNQLILRKLAKNQ